MNVIDLSKYSKRNYRNIEAFNSFQIFSNYILAVSDDKIFEIEIENGSSIFYDLSTQIKGLLVNGEVVYMIGRDEIFYWEGGLHSIGASELLSYAFVFKEYICLVEINKISIFSTMTKMTIGTIDVENSNGMCSSAYTIGDNVYFGYENGKIYKIDFQSKIENLKRMENEKSKRECKGDSTKPINKVEERDSIDILDSIKDSENMTNRNIKKTKIKIVLIDEELVIDLGEPVLFISENNSIFYFVSISHKIVKYSKNEEVTYTMLDGFLRKVFPYGDFLICFDDSTVIFLDKSMKLLKYHKTKFIIKDIHIKENEMFIGYENGIITLYDLKFLNTL